LAINFRFLFKAEQTAKASNGCKNLKRITSFAYMKSSEGRETLDKSETKILKSKILNGTLRYSRKKWHKKKKEKKNYI